MRVVVALGGNALQRRGERMTVDNQRANVAVGLPRRSPRCACDHEVVISHGNGPQVGLLALQAASYGEEESYPFDVLGAQTEGMIGYFIEQELGNLLPFEKPLATILTMTEVGRGRPGLRRPEQVRRPGLRRGDGPPATPPRRAGRSSRTARTGGGSSRRPCPGGSSRSGRSPGCSTRAPSWSARAVAASRRCTGPGTPGARRRRGGHRQGPVQRVLAKDLEADTLIIATDADAVYLDWGTPQQRAIAEATPDALGAVRLRRRARWAPRSRRPATSRARPRARSR